MKEIKLTKGRTALVDDADFFALNQDSWIYNGRYAVRNVTFEGQKHKERMHHRILPSLPGKEVDHIDGNALNNQRGNLRYATTSQNQANRRAQRNNTSGFKGVTRHKQAGKWLAQMQVRGKYLYLGLYDDPHDAARAYNRAAREHFADFAKCNEL